MFEFIAQIFRNMFVFVGMVTTKSSFPPALTPEEEQALLKKLAAACEICGILECAVRRHMGRLNNKSSSVGKKKSATR